MRAPTKKHSPIATNGNVVRHTARAALLEAGFADNLMFPSNFSSDTQLKRNNKDLGCVKTLTVFVPKLKAAGASDEVLRKIMVDNPRRFLAFAPKVKRAA
jgi:predicted metal-dependent phosphotriesterase family hydrolase